MARERLWRDESIAKKLETLNVQAPAKQSIYADMPDAYSINDPYVQFATQLQYSNWDGEKFPGGFGPTQLFRMDYYSLRKRSRQIFIENQHGYGIINRLVTNEINTGIFLEAEPEEGVLGVEEDSLIDWSDEVENLFRLWGENPQLCDEKGMDNWGMLQRRIRMDALVSGDVLLIVQVDRVSRLPRLQIIDADRVRNPFGFSQNDLAQGNRIEYGVEIDARGRQVAYHVADEDGLGSTRVPAFGARSGRRVAWLVYGTERRDSAVRGVPLLSIVLQSLKELDRYKESTLRKAVINSLLALVVKKTEERQSTDPLTNAAVRNEDVTVDTGVNTSAVSTGDTTRRLRFSELMPGTSFDSLGYGEELEMFNPNGVDLNYDTFQQAVLRAIAWAFEVPPEILLLEFSSNYSASQAALNEFRIYLAKARFLQSSQVNQPMYEIWLRGAVIRGLVQADGFLETVNNRSRGIEYAAWVSANWLGAVKPSTDPLKMINTEKEALLLGATNYALVARNTNGTNFRRNIKRQRRELEQLRDLRPTVASEGEQDEQNTTTNAIDESAKEEIIMRVVEELNFKVEAANGIDK